MTAGGPWRGEDMSGPHRTEGDSVSRGCSAPPMLPEAMLEVVSRGWWSPWRGGHRELGTEAGRGWQPPFSGNGAAGSGTGPSSA